MSVSKEFIITTFRSLKRFKEEFSKKQWKVMMISQSQTQ